MRRSVATVIFTPLGRLLYVVAVLGVLTLPVSYRGGADVPHAHAIFQLWFDAAHGSTDHHRRWLWVPVAARPEHLANPPSAAATVVGDSEVPRLAELTPAHERPMIIAAVTALGLALLLAGRVVAWGAPAALTGLRPRPETPPPRFVTALIEQN